MSVPTVGTLPTMSQHCLLHHMQHTYCLTGVTGRCSGGGWASCQFGNSNLEMFTAFHTSHATHSLLHWCDGPPLRWGLGEDLNAKIQVGPWLQVGPLECGPNVVIMHQAPATM